MINAYIFYRFIMNMFECQFNIGYNLIKLMKSYIVRKTQKTVSLKRDKSLQSEDGMRSSSIKSIA